jgi:hypothetical protein
MTAISWFKTPSGARSLVACLITLPAFAQTQPPIFPVPTSTPGFNGAVTGDFNGDGLPDQVYISSATATTVLLNQGTSNPPTPVVTSGLTCTPQNLVAADMNKDTRLDVVLTCVEGYVAVLLGNGDGTFQTPSYYAVTGANAIATPVDLNGDGYLDIAVGGGTTAVNPANDTFTAVVLLNSGASAPGTLVSPKSYAVTKGSSPIEIGDFNGDGKQDIVIGSPARVLLGNGDGTLQTPIQTQAVSPYVTADFNNDGRTDLAYLMVPATDIVGTTSVQILLGASNGTFVTGYNQVVSSLEDFQFIIPFKNTATSNTTNLALVGNDTLILLGDGSGNFVSGQAYGVSTSAIVGNKVSTQTGANGNTNLVLYQYDLKQNFIINGNGDGTFQAPPATILPYGLFAEQAGIPVTADLNGDGLTDVLAADFGGNLIAALGRGNGRFAVTAQNTGSTQPQGSPMTPVIASGDFNGDGKPDAIIILPGALDQGSENVIDNSQMFLYSGNGDGTFKPSSAAVVLSVYGAGTPLVADFNGDGKLDLILSYGGFVHSGPLPNGTLFFAGHGDGTFAAPVTITTSGPNNGVAANLGFVADLNNDGKLDFVGQNTVYLGNGDGTFNQQPLGIAGTLLALGDLNGDGKADLVIGNNTSTAIYAGNGDGTFRTTPYFTTSLTGSASIGDVNGDGHADLLLANGQLSVLFGDGTGNFTADPNSYYPTTGNPSGTLARLNNQAPPLPNDNKLDYLYLSVGAVSSYLNQLNPTPATPAPLPSKTTLATSATSAAPGQQLTLTATITGATPTGTVSFVSGSTTLGTAPIMSGTATLTTSIAAAGTYSVVANYPGDANNTTSSSSPVSIIVAPVTSTTVLSVSAGSAGTNQQLTFTATVTGLNPTGKVTFASPTATLGTASLVNGVATLPFAFTAVGSYAVTATYAGDVANLGSASTPVTVTVAAPDYTITASPSSATIKAGQSATTTLTVTPIGGYSGTVKFSCGTLPTGANCTFAPASVTPTSGVVTSTLTITTTAPTTALLRTLSIPLQGIAWASLIFLTLSPRKLRGVNRRLTRASLLIVFLAVGLLSFSGCSSSSPSKPPTNTGTPAGVQTITVTAADSSGSLSHPINFQVTVQ